MCGIWGLPSPTARKSYFGHCDALFEAAATKAEQCVTKAADDAIQDGCKDIAVSTDGTWMRRGYSSLYGVQSAIAFDTGKLIDVEMLSRSCPACSHWSSKLEKQKISQDEFDTWFASHGDSCLINTTASAQPAAYTSAAL
eukprot:scpid91926/ scgid17719/ 